jgi:hypothetical protein
MYLLYLDDAGSVLNSSDTHVVLAGIALFERQVHFLDRLLSDLAAEIAPQAPHELEFHASHMHAGKGFWRSIKDRAVRRRLLAEALSKGDQLKGKWALFGVAVEKKSVSPDDALEYAFEQVISRFDRFLGRMHRKHNTQRGLLILDRSTQETRLQGLTRDFRQNGHRWGRLNNMVDVPFFADSRATRAIQYADMVAYALWRHYEKGDSEFFNIIETAFDAEGGVRHGLHVRQGPALVVPVAHS